MSSNTCGKSSFLSASSIGLSDYSKNDAGRQRMNNQIASLVLWSFVTLIVLALLAAAGAGWLG
jgi:hypothetical protein